ncbi:Colostrum trypsin inhibitor isoform 2 [Schistosoma japonicum]|nr:Colostrum trypsin inhibitor isoform 2 [Schistosoma japonicum]
MPVKHGYCLQNQLRYYYDSVKNKCQPFIYKGCGGNENRFSSNEICEQMCVKKKTINIVGNQLNKPTSSAKIVTTVRTTTTKKLA